MSTEKTGVDVWLSVIRDEPMTKDNFTRKQQNQPIADLIVSITGTLCV